MIEKIWIGSLFGCLVAQLVGSLVGWWQTYADTNVTLAFEDAQLIPPLSRKEINLGHIWDIFWTYLGHIKDI